MAQQLIAEGKTKQIFSVGDDTSRNLVEIVSKIDITAGDGDQHDVITDKDIFANTTTCNNFRLLNHHGVPTHFRSRESSRSFIADWLQMIPLEVVVRGTATGSYLKRYPDVLEGTEFPWHVVELFYKDDDNHDPQVIFDFVGGRLLWFNPKLPLAEGFLHEKPLRDIKIIRQLTSADIDTVRRLALKTFVVLKQAWARFDVTLVDLKIEFGWTSDGRLVIGDVIDNDSWRIWKGGTREGDVSKQNYRDLFAESADPKAVAKGLAAVKDDYSWVADQSGLLLPQ